MSQHSYSIGQSITLRLEKPTISLRPALLTFLLVVLTFSLSLAQRDCFAEFRSDELKSPGSLQNIEVVFGDCTIASSPIQSPSEGYLLRGNNGAFTSILTPQTKLFSCIPCPHTISPLLTYANRTSSGTTALELLRRAPVAPRAP